MKESVLVVFVVAAAFYILKDWLFGKGYSGADSLGRARSIIQSFESFHKDLHNGYVEAYADSSGYPTIGWGNRFYADGKQVQFGDTRAVQEMHDLFDKTTADLYNNISNASLQPLTPAQLAALTSFAYNVGKDALYNSTLWDLLQSGIDKTIVALQFDRWVYSKGQILTGLVNRRKEEKALFLS